MNKKGLVALLLAAIAWASQAQNILLRTNATSSTASSPAGAAYANDGDMGSAWNSGGYAPAWVQVEVPTNHPPIGLIRLIPAQTPNGSTSHSISVQHRDGGWEEVANINRSTSDKQPIDVTFKKPLSDIKQIKITTKQSPSWVAWYEIQAFAADTGAEVVGNTKGVRPPPGFVINKAGDEVLDTSTGWVWMRCSLGQNWNGQTCIGKAQDLSIDAAVAEARAKPGWEVPSVSQLVSLRVCSTGVDRSRISVKGQGGGEFDRWCNNGSNHPTIDTIVFPNTLANRFWTSSPFADGSNLAWFVDFSSGDVYSNLRNLSYRVRLVRTSQFFGAQSALAFWHGRTLPKQADFSLAARAQAAEMEQRLGTVQLVWEPKATGQSPALSANAPPLNLEIMADIVKALVIADVYLTPTSTVASQPGLTAPERDAFRPQPIDIPAKGEFETSAIFEARRQRAEQEAKETAERAYQTAVAKFNAAQQQQAKLEAENAAAHEQAEARKTDPQAYRNALLKAWEDVILPYVGNPEVQDIAYDADKQSFTAKLMSGSGLLFGQVTAPVALAQAPGIKADLLSGKIAPKVTFAYPSMRMDWALTENIAQRAGRFAAAKDSIGGLEALIREFPDAPETSPAKRRIAALIAQEFRDASSSSQLQSVLNKYPNAAEAPAARQRIDQLRLAAIAQEFRDASSSSQLQSVLNKYPNAAEAPAARKRIVQLRVDEQRAERLRALEDERRAKADRERIATGCDRFYLGKKIGFKPAGFIYFGNVLDAVVLGKGGGYVSIKITDTHFDSYGKTLEVSCTSDQLQ